MQDHRTTIEKAVIKEGKENPTARMLLPFYFPPFHWGLSRDLFEVFSKAGLGLMPELTSSYRPYNYRP